MVLLRRIRSDLLIGFVCECSSDRSNTHHFIQRSNKTKKEHLVVCSHPPGTYTMYITDCTFFMICFGLWTMRNILQMGRATHPTDAMNEASVGSYSSRTVQPKDHQCIGMLLVDTVFYVDSKILYLSANHPI